MLLQRAWDDKATTTTIPMSARGGARACHLTVLCRPRARRAWRKRGVRLAQAAGWAGCQALHPKRSVLTRSAGEMFASTAARAPAVALQRSAGECSTSAARCEPVWRNLASFANATPRRSALRRAGGSCRGSGRGAAFATMTPRRTEDSPASSSTGTARAPAAPLLHVGACAVEEAALASALGTVVAHEAGTLKSRRLRYEACSPETLEQAYDRCGVVTEDYGRTFYMGAQPAARAPAARGAPARRLGAQKAPGLSLPSVCLRTCARPPACRARRSRRRLRRRAATQLMTEQRRKAIWAIYGAPGALQRAATQRLTRRLAAPRAAVWCRRTDELVDGPNSPYITPAALDRWTVRGAAAAPPRCGRFAFQPRFATPTPRGRLLRRRAGAR